MTEQQIAERLLYLIHFHVSTEATEKDVQGILSGLEEDDIYVVYEPDPQAGRFFVGVPIQEGEA